MKNERMQYIFKYFKDGMTAGVTLTKDAASVTCDMDTASALILESLIGIRDSLDEIRQELRNVAWAVKKNE